MTEYLLLYFILFVGVVWYIKIATLDFLNQRDVNKTFKDNNNIVKKYIKEPLLIKHRVITGGGTKLDFSIKIDSMFNGSKYSICLFDNYTSYQVVCFDLGKEVLLSNEAANSFFFEQEFKIGSFVNELRNNILENYKLEKCNYFPVIHKIYKQRKI